MKKLILSISCLSALTLNACGDIPEPTNKTPQPAETAAAAEPPIKITATELLNAYKENEVGANKKFKGKLLSIAATIESIDADFSDNPYLVLKAGGDMDMFMRPQAHLAKSEHDKAADLKKGQKVNLTCTGNSEIGGVPMLADCTIQ